MADFIKLLPDSVANQIAAGEVVQRPASAVKELLENSLDAGATDIRLLIKDGGTTLIQVIDNGSGMSDTDARMCWERHATSKINTAHDLFALRTFGFRGEALASIAAVAQVEMKTRREKDDAATLIRIEGSEVLEQSLTAAPVGTSIAIKNLFFNIPARRNFLKTIPVESRHVMEEFQRQALAHPQVAFSMFNNGNEVFILKPATLAQRIADVLGRTKDTDLLELTEPTEIVSISGYVGIPSVSKKTRGDQYFFVNGRFIRSPYFNHAVQSAYEGLADPGSYPLFVLNLTIDPAKVDVNVHPTKTEVKFEDEKHIYNILKSAVRKALGSFVIQPDMELFGMGGLESFLNQPLPVDKPFLSRDNDLSQPSQRTPNWNPFHSDTPYKRDKQDWTKILGSTETRHTTETPVATPRSEHLPLPSNPDVQVDAVFQIYGSWLVVKMQGSLYVLDQKAAHQKILFEQYRRYLQSHSGVCQQLLFPRTIELSPAHAQQMLEITEDLHALGFDISHVGNHAFIVNGLPAELQRGDETLVLEQLLEDYLQTQGDVKLRKHDSLALSLARQTSVSANTILDQNSMESLVNQLFQLPEWHSTPDGKTIMVKFGTEFLMDLFRKQKR